MLGIFSNTFSSNTETFVLNHIMHYASRGPLVVICHSYDRQFVPENMANIRVVSVTPSTSFFKRLMLLPFFILSKKGLRNLRLLKLLNYFKFGRSALNLSLYFAGYGAADLPVTVLHCHFGQNGNIFSQLMDAGVVSWKLITHFHGLDFTQKVYHRKYYASLINRRSINIAVTDFSKDCLIRIGFSDDTIKVIPVGTNLHFFRRQAELPSDVLRVLFVGRLIELKGVLLIPHICKKVLERSGESVVFSVIGDGPLHDELKDLVEKLSLQNNCLLLGRRSVAEIRSEMEKSSIFLYPGIKDRGGRVENQCVGLQEAMAMLLPAVVSEIGGVPESVLDGDTGFVCEPGNVDQFAEKIALLVADKNLRFNFGRAARNFVSRKYDLSTNYKAFDTLYFGENK